jgi:hypothetical protein
MSLLGNKIDMGVNLKIIQYNLYCSAVMYVLGKSEIIMKESIHAIIMYYMGDDSVVSKS